MLKMTIILKIRELLEKLPKVDELLNYLLCHVALSVYCPLYTNCKSGIKWRLYINCISQFWQKSVRFFSLYKRLFYVINASQLGTLLKIILGRLRSVAVIKGTNFHSEMRNKCLFIATFLLITYMFTGNFQFCLFFNFLFISFF